MSNKVLRRSGSQVSNQKRRPRAFFDIYENHKTARTFVPLFCAWISR